MYGAMAATLREHEDAGNANLKGDVVVGELDSASIAAEIGLVFWGKVMDMCRRQAHCKANILTDILLTGTNHAACLKLLGDGKESQNIVRPVGGLVVHVRNAGLGQRIVVAS